MNDVEQYQYIGIFDINGTIYASSSGLPQSILAGFANLHAEGVKTTVVTGRSHSTAVDLLGDNWTDIISEDMPVSLENGGRLAAQDGTNLAFYPIHRETIDALIDAALQADTMPRYLAYTPKEPGARNILWLPPDGTPEEYVKENGDYITVDNGSLAKFAARMIFAGACMVRVGSISPDIMESLEGVNVFINQNELNVLADDVDKGTGVGDIAEFTNTSPDHILVAGNDFNDVPMLNLPVGERILVASALNDTLANVQATRRLETPDELGQYLARFRRLAPPISSIPA